MKTLWMRLCMIHKSQSILNVISKSGNKKLKQYNDSFILQMDIVMNSSLSSYV